MTSVRVAAPVDPSTARREAQHILSDRRFRPSATPRPLRGPLRWLGDRIESAFGPLGRLLALVPGWTWLVALALVVAAVAWIVARRARRRVARTPTAKLVRGGPDDGEDPPRDDRQAERRE